MHIDTMQHRHGKRTIATFDLFVAAHSVQSTEMQVPSFRLGDPSCAAMTDMGESPREVCHCPIKRQAHTIILSLSLRTPERPHQLRSVRFCSTRQGDRSVKTCYPRGVCQQNPDSLSCSRVCLCAGSLKANIA